MSTHFKSRLAVLSAILALTLTLNLNAGGRRRVLAASPLSSGLALVFLGGELLDAGPVAGRTTNTVRLRIGPPSREPRGTATVRAYLEVPDPRCVVRIDGIVLGAAPRVIRRHAAVGIPLTYRIDIEVPPAAAEGPLQTSIGWEITTE